MSKFRNLLIALAALALLVAAEVNAAQNSRTAPAAVMATDGTGATAPGQTGTPESAASAGANGTTATPGQGNLNGRAHSAEAQSHYREHWWQFWREGRPEPTVTQ